MDRTPRRVQRTRIALSKQPPTDRPKPRYCGRPTKFGNPFEVAVRTSLARVPAADMVTPWEYEGRDIPGRIPDDGIRYDMVWPGGEVTEHHVRYMTIEECVATHRRALIAPTDGLRLVARSARTEPDIPITVDLVRFELAGQDLSCWCKPGRACHADTLLWVANAPLDEIKMAIEDEYEIIRATAERVAQLHPELLYADRPADPAITEMTR